MFTLLECLYNLLAHITEEHASHVPPELKSALNDLTIKLEKWLDKEDPA